MPLFRERPDLLRPFRAGERKVLGTVYDRYVDVVGRLVRRGCQIPVGRRRLRQPPGLHGRHARRVREGVPPPARQGYDGLREYQPYLLMIARNTLIDLLRRKGGDARLADALEQLPSDDVPRDDAAPWQTPRPWPPSSGSCAACRPTSSPFTGTGTTRGCRRTPPPRRWASRGRTCARSRTGCAAGWRVRSPGSAPRATNLAASAVDRQWGPSPEGVKLYIERARRRRADLLLARGRMPPGPTPRGARRCSTPWRRGGHGAEVDRLMVPATLVAAIAALVLVVRPGPEQPGQRPKGVAGGAWSPS